MKKGVINCVSIIEAIWRSMLSIKLLSELTGMYVRKEAVLEPLRCFLYTSGNDF